MFTRVRIDDALNAFTSGDLEAADAAIAPLTTVTLRQTREDGTVEERTFDVVFDADNETFRRDGAVQSWGTTLGSNDDLLDTEVSGELLTEGERTISFETDNDCLHGLDDTLGTGLGGSGTTCFDNRATFEEIARRALADVGIDLVIFTGPGLPFLDRKVDFEYRTEGKTIRQILNETILTSQPRSWGAGLVLYVDGRALQAAALPAIPSISSYSRSVALAPEIAVPVLEETEYEPPPDCEDTFETADTATRSYRVTSGSGDDEQEIEYFLEKQGGQVVREEERRYGFVPVVSGNPVWALIYEVVKTHEYHPLCAEALLESIEVIRQARTDFAYWDFTVSPGPSGFGKVNQVKDFVPPLYESSRKVITQRWHAEGWLQQRTESHLEAAGVIVNVFGSVGAIAYKRSSRTEEYTPTGNGQWWVRITEAFPVDKPILESVTDPDAGATDYDITGVFPVGATNSYSRPTDGPPPQISCGEAVNPCDPNQTPEEQAQEKFDFETARRDAILSNLPDRNVFQLTLAELALGYRIGQFVSGAYVAGVTFEIDPDSGSVSTNLELWTLKV